MISLFSSAEKESQLWWHVLSFHLTNWKFMQFDRNSSRFCEIFTWSGMTLSSLVLFFIGQSQFHAFKSLSALIFFRFSLRNSQKHQLCFLFFDSPLSPLVTSFPKFSKNYELWKSTPRNISPYELVRRANWNTGFASYCRRALPAIWQSSILWCTLKAGVP